MLQETGSLLQTAVLSGQNLSSPFLPGQQASSLYFFLIFIAVIVALRMYRGLNGRLYSTVRVIRLPAIYVILTVFTVVAVGLIDNIILATLLFIPAGFLLGYRFGTNAKFFSRNNQVYYTRPPGILLIWLVSFVVRYALEFAYPNNITAIMVVDSALSLTTGLLAGEALNIVNKKKAFDASSATGSRESESFRINP